MPRAHRYFIPGHIWFITHRCHNNNFLLKFAKDRCHWIHWLYQARRRYQLCVLNYMVTSNHIHLLVYDSGQDRIARSMQLVASQVARHYNRRKQRQGVFWEGRYHATAIDAGRSLLDCMVYMDLNMVRAGRVSHPRLWQHCAYHELYQPRRRYRIIDIASLLAFSGAGNLQSLQQQHNERINRALSDHDAMLQRDSCWTEALAIGDKAFVQTVQQQLGILAYARECREITWGYQIKEEMAEYGVADG